MPSPHSTPPAPVFRMGRGELIFMMGSLMALQALAIDIVLPSLGDLAADLRAPAENDRQLVVGVFIFFTGVGALFPGPLADRFGRRPVLLATLSLFVVLSLACAMATSFHILLAMRALQGIATAAAMVLPMVIIRDNFAGDSMARLTSLMAMVFLAVPVLAPSLGQAVLSFGNWRAIFAVLAGFGAILMAWVFFRLPETLHAAYRQSLGPATIARNMRQALIERQAFGYSIGSGLLMGAMLGYVMSSQQLIGEHFGAGSLFVIIYGTNAMLIAAANFINSRIVERFGARRVSHGALVIYIAASLCQVIVAVEAGLSLLGYLPFLALNVALMGFLGANFGSLAMAPFAETAGAASSTQGFLRLSIGALVGTAIGAAYNGSALPLAAGFLLCGLATLCLVLFSEHGRLFKRHYDPYLPPLP